jgi:hypothetical protein
MRGGLSWVIHTLTPVVGCDHGLISDPVSLLGRTSGPVLLTAGKFHSPSGPTRSGHGVSELFGGN